MIRNINDYEIPQLVGVAKRFHESLGLKGFNESHFLKTMDFVVPKHGFVSVKFNGEKPVEAICMMIAPDCYTGKNRAMSAFWFVDPDQTGNLGKLCLFDYVERQCGFYCVDEIVISSPVHGNSEAIERVLNARGYSKLETVFSRK